MGNNEGRMRGDREAISVEGSGEKLDENRETQLTM